MKRKAVSGIMLTLLLISMLTLAFNIKPVKGTWTGTVYIRADGSVDPPDALIITYDNVTYTLTDNISSSADGIIVERDNIVVDGAGYAVQGTGAYESKGLDLSGRRNVTIKNTQIKNFWYSVSLNSSNYNSITANNITNNSYDGLYLESSSKNIITANNIIANKKSGVELRWMSSYNTISRNNIGNSGYGIAFIDHSNNNSIFENNLANNFCGILFSNSNRNSIFHNNFVGNWGNWGQAYIRESYGNVWDDGYPSGGNYWSDYTGVDTKSGPYQNETGSDGIGDTPYVIDENNQDNYPLMEPWAPVTLTVIGPWSGAEMDAFLPILARFEALSGINVKYRVLRAGDLATLLPAQFAAGTTPGDVIFMWAWWIAQQAQEGHILEVTDLVDATNFLPGTFDQVNVTGKIYGGAYTGKVKPGFWYRKSFFTAHGLSEPTTWNEFLDLLDHIKAIKGIVNPIATGDGVGWPISDIVEHFLITFGSPELHKNLTAGTVAWNSSQVRTIFADKIVPLLTGGYFSEPIEWTTALDLWWGGDYGLYFMGSWITGMVDNATDLGVFSLPGAEGLVFGADYFFIPAYTKYPEEAKQLFQFLASEEAQSIQVAQGGHIATNIHVSLDAYPPVDREVAELLEGMEVLPDLDDTIGGEFQLTFWDQLKLLWTDPTKLDDVLNALQSVAPGPPTPPVLTAIVNIDPDTLNLKSNGMWITAYIELPEGYNVSDIDRTTIMLNGTIPVDPFWVDKPLESVIGDYDNDTVQDLMVKFNRTAVSEFILSKGIKYGNVTLSITGQLYDGTPFEGSDMIMVRMPGDVNMDGKVDIFDIASVAVRYGQFNPDPYYDLTEDGKIDIRDVVIVAVNFGKTYQ